MLFCGVQVHGLKVDIVVPNHQNADELVYFIK